MRSEEDLRAALKASDKYRKDAAEALGIGRSGISQFLAGKRHLKADEAAKLEAFLAGDLPQDEPAKPSAISLDTALDVAIQTTVEQFLPAIVATLTRAVKRALAQSQSAPSKAEILASGEPDAAASEAKSREASSPTGAEASH